MTIDFEAEGAGEDENETKYSSSRVTERLGGRPMTVPTTLTFTATCRLGVTVGFFEVGLFNDKETRYIIIDINITRNNYPKCV